MGCTARASRSNPGRFANVFVLLLLIPIALACDDPADPVESQPRVAASARAPLSQPLGSAGARAEGAAPSSPASAAPRRPVPEDDAIRQAPIEEQRRHVLSLLESELDANPSALERIEEILDQSDWLSFGNPRISRPALSRRECHARRSKAKVAPASPQCGSPNMVFVPNAGTEMRERAGVCIDQYEFPNVACEFPLVWVRSTEAARICDALGKRLCDAHEWEGGCAGSVLEPKADYAWDRIPKLYDQTPRRDRRLQMEYLHNESRSIAWAYGPETIPQRCGTSVRKDSRCSTVDWGICPTTSFPAGSFPDCVSSVGVYDQHGNVAEHMSLPLFEKELGGRGETEMKGSWFAFDHESPHPDDCRWRARNWHTTRVGHFNSHRSYHLGFRCCKDVAAPGRPEGSRNSLEKTDPP